jgi:hypothetical protein
MALIVTWGALMPRTHEPSQGAGDEGARVAEGRPAVHAPGALLAELLGRERLVELVPVVEPVQGVAVAGQLALVLEEAGRLAQGPLTRRVMEAFGAYAPAHCGQGAFTAAASPSGRTSG